MGEYLAWMCIACLWPARAQIPQSTSGLISVELLKIKGLIGPDEIAHREVLA